MIVTHPNVRRWTVAYSQDVRDDRLNPRSGSLSRYAVQLANAKSGGQGNYLHFEVMNGLHLPRGNGGALSARVRAALLAPVGPGPQGENVLDRVEQTDRLYIGGVSSLRGYHENGVDDGGNGGRLMLNLNLELRIPLTGLLSTALFLDGGNVWRHLEDVKLERMVTAQGVGGTYGAADMRYAIGTGIRIRTPIGPMRLDYGWRLHSDESDLLAGRKLERSLVQFGIGQMF
jgi:outer membrane protein assembly factor BamA